MDVSSVLPTLSPERSLPCEIEDSFTRKGNFASRSGTVTCKSVQSQTQNTEVPRAGGIKPSRRQEAFSLSLSEAAEGLSLVELPARGEDSKGKLGHSVFEERENDLGDVEGRRVLGSSEGESDSGHGDRERVLGGCSLGDGKRKLEAGENVGTRKFDIDQALVKELTPNRGGLRFLSECPPFEKAISVSAGFEVISAEGFEAISVEGFEAISAEGFQAESAGTDVEVECAGENNRVELEPEELLPVEAHFVEETPQSTKMTSGAGSSKAADADFEAIRMKQAAVEAEDLASATNEGVMAKVGGVDALCRGDWKPEESLPS
ncbi:hypothetical protein R1sor_021845 [Riccia sorocarpa]|uniref:Uncharacterized protein n=1 Tax=Riccia sorocarpa TaxID=122646 RepID=A0ABD3GNZ3_9MARC